MRTSVDLSQTRGVLCDIDGTLTSGDELIPGAAEAIAYLRERGLALRFLTNTTTRSRGSLHSRLTRLGLELSEQEIISAAYAGVLYLRSHGSPRVRLVVSDDAGADYAEFTFDEDSPQCIVVGDVGDRWNHALLNSLFRQVSSGATLVALHRNRFYHGHEGVTLDVGAFVAAVEYGASVEATIVGKPSPWFFQLAFADLRLSPHEVVVIGDDPESDIDGAFNAGAQGILVRTGKYHAAASILGRNDGTQVVDSIDSVRDLW